MSILTPLWWSTISAWTLMPARTQGSLVTASPSTTSRVESSTVSPTLAVGILSTSTMSPTATLCWRPPLRTMAYTRISLSLGTDPLMPAARTGRGPRQSGRMSGLPRGRITGRDVLRGWAHMEHAGGQGYGGGVGEVKPSSSAESYTSDPAPRPKHDGTAIASVG